MRQTFKRPLPCLFVLAVVSPACDSDPRADLLGEVFAALKDHDAARFRRCTITTADFDLRAQGVSPFKASMTYLGGVIRPEEQAAHQKAFERAARGGQGFIDFTQDRFAGGGTLLGEGSRETLGGSFIPYQVYSALVRRQGQTVDSKDLYPRFVIAPWGDGFRLLDLLLPPDE